MSSIFYEMMTERRDCDVSGILRVTCVKILVTINIQFVLSGIGLQQMRRKSENGTDTANYVVPTFLRILRAGNHSFLISTKINILLILEMITY